MKETREINIFWDAINFERAGARGRIIEGQHYKKTLIDPKRIYFKLPIIYPFYVEYCKHSNHKDIDLSTLTELLCILPEFVPSKQKSRGGRAQIVSGFGSAYEFEYTDHDQDSIKIGEKIMNL